MVRQISNDRGKASPRPGQQTSDQRRIGGGRPALPLLLLVLAGATALPQDSDPQPPKATLAIVGGYLIDGHEGPPIRNSVVLVDGKEIVAVGTTDSLKVPRGAKVIDAAGYTVMPGLIDSHVHLDILGFGDYERWHKTYAPRYAEIMAISAKQLLSAGVTTAVDLSGQPEGLIATRDKIEKGQIPGPRLKLSMGFICNYPDAFFATYRRAAFSWNAHTVEEARAAVQKVLNYGADVVKVYNSLSAGQIKVIAEEAHKKGLKVTGHAGDNEDLVMRIRNGQDGVEHIYMGFDPDDPETIREMVRHRTFVDPTNVQNLAANLAVTEDPLWTDNPRAKALTPVEIWKDFHPTLKNLPRLAYFRGEIRPRLIMEQGRRVKALYDAGLRIIVGTDSGGQAMFHTDSTWRQMDLMVRYGMPPMEVISAATRIPAQIWGMGDKLGTIEPGRLADIIVVDGNPLTHMGDLKHVVYVIKDGVQYKDLGAATTTSSKP